MPARTNARRLASTSRRGSIPSQVSAPHSPVANASVNAVTLAGSVERPSTTIGIGTPATAVEIALLSGASATGTYLYGLYTKCGAVPGAGIAPPRDGLTEERSAFPVDAAHPDNATARPDP